MSEKVGYKKMQDPEARKAKDIVVREGKKKPKKVKSSSVSSEQFSATVRVIKFFVWAVGLGIVGYAMYYGIKLFIG